MDYNSVHRRYWQDFYGILKNNYSDIYDNLIVAFMHGSVVYGTATEKSDRDIIIIVDDNIDLSQYTNNIREIHHIYDNKEYDFQIINDSTFKTMIYDHHIIAVESLFMFYLDYTDKEVFDKKYKNLFVLDKWKLRQVISGIVNNSYAKCHKKLTVEKDYDLYRAQKSIFHCIRLYIFGIQIANSQKITDYFAANKYWDEIKQMGDNWEDYKNKYKPLLNELRSELVKLCPKPI